MLCVCVCVCVHTCVACVLTARQEIDLQELLCTNLSNWKLDLY